MFKDKFEKLLKESGTTRYKIHKQVGADQGTLCRILGGYVTTPKYEVAKSLGDYFKVSVSYLYEDQEGIKNDFNKITEKMLKEDKIDQKTVDALFNAIEEYYAN